MKTERLDFLGRSAKASTRQQAGKALAGALCLETQSRQIMATLVNDVVADALRLGLYDTPAEQNVKANGAPLLRRTAG